MGFSLLILVVSLTFHEMRICFEVCNSVHSSEECVKHTLTLCVPPPEENAGVWYSLLPGPGYELFSINPYTGLITTTSYLDREQQQHFPLRGNTHSQFKPVTPETHRSVERNSALNHTVGVVRLGSVVCMCECILCLLYICLKDPPPKKLDDSSQGVILLVKTHGR